MSQCDRRWEVEALRDQRVAAADRVRVERHIMGCADCAREQREFEALGAAIAALHREPVDELSVRRRRAAMLSRVYQDTVSARRTAPGWAAAAVSLAAVGAAFLWWQRPTPPPLDQPSAVVAQSSSPEVLITADAGAVYSRTAAPNTSITLVRGRITLDVRGARGHAPVVVHTPDGEVEDRGTVFSVAVEGEQTRAVHVQTGSVVVRIHGLEARWLHAGEHFAPYQRAGAVAPPAPPSTASGKKVRKLHPPTEAPPPSGEAPVGNRAADLEFEAAMSALSQGRLVESAEAFEHFLAHHPADVRAEDAAFLSVVALERSDRPEEARTAAQRYLARFPHGLRVREVERALGGP